MIGRAAGALEKAGVEIEDVARIGFASRRTAQQQGELAVRYGVLGKIVVNDERVLALVAEILSDCSRRVGSQVEHRRRFGGGRRDDDGVIHGAVFGERLNDLRNRGALLPDHAIDADQVLALAVDDGVEGDGGLAGLTVADDQLALSAADGNHRIDGLQSGHHRLAHRLTGDDTGRQALYGQGLLGFDRALIVNRLTEGVDHAADHRVAHGHAQNLAGTLDLVALANLGVVAHQHRAHLILFEVHGQAGNAVGKLDQLAGHHLVQAVNTRDTVAQRDHGADFIDTDLGIVVCDLLSQELCNFICVYLRHASLFQPDS
jgi:hypothetical protein